MTVNILLADDHKITRTGLKALIEKETDFQVIAEAENGRRAVQLALKLEPDVIVMDINMPDLNGIDATRQITAELPGVKVIALSMYADKRYVIGMLKAGVSGYLLKNCAFEELTAAIKSVVKGRNYMSSEVADKVMKGYADNLKSTEQVVENVALSAREREVLQLIAEGKSSSDIADALFISVKTVSTHRKKIMEKLNTDNLADLIKYAIREGLTSMET